MQVQSLGWEDPLEEEMATHSSVPAWRIPWTEEPGGVHTVHGAAKSWARLSDWAPPPPRSNVYYKKPDFQDVTARIHSPSQAGHSDRDFAEKTLGRKEPGTRVPLHINLQGEVGVNFRLLFHWGFNSWRKCIFKLWALFCSWKWMWELGLCCEKVFIVQLLLIPSIIWDGK